MLNICISIEDNVKCNDFKIIVYFVFDNIMYIFERILEEEI